MLLIFTKNQNKMNVPIELINRILLYRPCHPVALMIKTKIEEYYEEDLDYGQYRSHYSGIRQLYTHEFISFKEWAFICINRE